MEEDRKDLIAHQTNQTLNRLFSDLSDEQTILIDHIKDKILSNISQYAKMTEFRKPVEKVEAIFLKKTAHLSQDEQTILKRALVAKLVLHLPAIVGKMNLSDSILALYPDAFGRLADFLKSSVNEPYDSTGEFFCKDVRFALGLSVPCGVLGIDMTSRITLSSVVLSLFRSRKISGVIRFAQTGGNGHWFRGHLDSRYTNEFNEQGFDSFYLRVAELLERRKDINGYIGTSWLYDPQLLEISPRLAFFQERPLERGAFLLRHGTQRSDVVNAIKASETRRRLYQEGKYRPICYSSLWPRHELISWAKQSRTFSRHD
jgi:hypothetical protein